MARKKSSDTQQRQERDLKPQPKPHIKSPRDLSPDNKMDNLKTLNQFLLKETMEKRFQIEQLKGQIDDIKEAQPFASDLEREVFGIVLASAMADQVKKLASLEKMLGSVKREREEMKKELGSVVKERDLMRKEADLRRKEIGELEVKVRDLERANVEMKEDLGLAVAEKDELERLGMKKEEGFDALKEMMEDLENEREEMSRMYKKKVDSMRAEIEANVARILALEEKGRGLLNVNQKLEGEARESKDEVGLLRREKEGLSSKVAELEQRNEEALGELKRLRADILVLEKEKESMERESESRVRELELKLADLSKKMGEISREKDEVEKARAEQEVEILELKEEVRKLHSNVVELEAMCADSGEKNARLLDEKDAFKKEAVALEKMVGEKEREFQKVVGELTVNLNDLTAKMRQLSLEKDEGDSVKAKQQAEISALKKEVDMLNSHVSELEEKCSGYGDQNTQLQDERDAVERELGVQREESGRLRLQFEEVKKSKDECLQELKQLNASLDALIREKDEGKRCIESLTEEKASLEKSHSATKQESDFLRQKVKAAEMISEKVLSLLKSTADAMNEAEKAQENGVVDDEEIRPFAEEVESIKGAFKSRVVKIEEMNRELGALQVAVDDAKKKKKPSLLMWLYPATTTVLAAISFAYAVRGR